MILKSSDKPKLIVGIGVSADGLESFTAFFSHMPKDCGLAFVLIPLLNSNHGNLIPELLSKKTNMTVVEASHNQLVKPNHVYVLPPAKNIKIKNGSLLITSIDSSEKDWTAIDNFLTSLAIDQKEKSVAVILSGTGNNGRLGLREIKLNGGIILAQEPSSTEFNQMPTNAIRTGLVDLVLLPKEIAKALIDYSRHPYLPAFEEKIPSDTEASPQQTLDLLRKRELFQTASKQWRLFKTIEQAHRKLLEIPARAFVAPRLRDELNTTRITLQSNNEEFKSSSEEVMSMNKELQSANDELETSKEELQSSNEELSTVNTELQSKLKELEKSTNDISKLLSSTDIATIFLNRQMQVMLFNSATTSLLSIHNGDVGRPISDFSAKVTNYNLIADVNEVLEKLIPVERDVWTNSDDLNTQCFLRRIVPYRSSDEHIIGVVITFINITERHQQKKLLEQRIIERTNELCEREERLKAIMKYATEAIIVIDATGLVTDFNNSAEKIFGYQSQKIIGKGIQPLFLLPYETDSHAQKNHLNTGIPEVFFTTNKLIGVHQNGTQFPMEMSFNRVEHLNIFVGIFRDLSEKQSLYKAMADISTRSQEKIGIELHDTVGQRLTGISLLVSDLKRKLTDLPQTPRDLMEEISIQLRETIGDTRDISHGLAPISLTPQGLEDAFDTLADTFNKADLKCEFELGTNKIIQDRTVAMEIYRIAQEAINNAVKHAAAHNIKLKLSSIENKFLLEINDDGCGFDPSKIDDTQGIGLNIMNYRASSISGLLKIDSTLGKGTKISCWF